jgi:hypothetical protein
MFFSIHRLSLMGINGFDLWVFAREARFYLEFAVIIFTSKNRCFINHSNGMIKMTLVMAASNPKTKAPDPFF